MSYLHRKLIPLHIRRLQKENQVRRSSINYRQAKNIGMLFSMSRLEDYEALRAFEKKLKAEGKELQVLCFLPKDVENFGLYYDFFTEKDFGKLGSVQAENIRSFIDQPFDMLLCMDCQPNQYLQYILAASKARFRIGCSNTEEVVSYFELMVRLPERTGVPELINQIYHYSNKV